MHRASNHFPESVCDQWSYYDWTEEHERTAAGQVVWQQNPITGHLLTAARPVSRPRAAWPGYWGRIQPTEASVSLPWSARFAPQGVSPCARAGWLVSARRTTVLSLQPLDSADPVSEELPEP